MKQRICRSSGQSLLELGIVVVIVAIIAAIAIPSLLKARRRANAENAMQVLTKIRDGEAVYQKGVGAGEFATLDKLIDAGDPVFTMKLEKGGYAGIFYRSGYNFRVEVVDGNIGPAQTQKWTAYAWPKIHGETGDRSFLMNSSGNTEHRSDQYFKEDGSVNLDADPMAAWEPYQPESAD